MKESIGEKRFFNYYKVQSFIISHSSDTGQRLDRFVKKYLPNAPLGGIYKMIRTGKIKINGKKKPETYIIEESDEITFWLTDEEIIKLQNKKEVEESVMNNEKSNQKVNNQRLEILYEDDYLMVINKPYGINVHPGDHKTKEISLIECVQDMLGTRYNSLTFKPSLVHRIDRDTSGCILIAKDKSTLESLLADLQSHKIDKIYHAVIRGKPREIKGTFREKLLRIENAKDEAKVRVDESGQTAVTHYQVIKSFAPIGIEGTTRENILSLVECRIETGRTHQIRVHLSYHNCPIIGDQAYGDRSINSYIRRQYGVNRQLLHAYSLSFIHPKTSKKMQVIAPYPSDFKRIISDSSEVQS